MSMSDGFRRLAFRTKEIALDRRPLQLVEQLEQSQWLGPEEMRRLQDERLRAVLDRAAREMPWYRERISRGQLAIEPSPVDAIGMWPLLTKRDVQLAAANLVNDTGGGRVHQARTSGSTGSPQSFYTNSLRNSYAVANWIRAWRWWGLDYGTKVLKLWGDHRATGLSFRGKLMARAKWLKDRAIGIHQVSAFQMRSEDLKSICDVIQRFRPDVIFGYGVALYLLASYIARQPMGFLGHKPTLVVYTAETLFSAQKDLIEAAFGAPCVAEYGSCECGIIAYECPARHLHLNDESLFSQVIDKSGSPLDSGIGRLVLTDLIWSRTPYIRYVLGDLVELAPDGYRCSCGRGLTVITGLRGRCNEVIWRTDGSPVHPLVFSHIFRNLQGLRRFQVRVGLAGKILVILEIDEVLLASSRADILAKLNRWVGQEFTWEIRSVSEIHQETPGKFVWVVHENEA